jgi:hypothetical protein
MAGYSGKALVDKLGLKRGMKAGLVGAPAGYETALQAGLSFSKLGRGMDFIQFFTRERTALEAKLPKFKDQLAPTGMLWVSWPKKNSSLRKDLDEHGVRELGIQSGLVDVKVCAVDEDWSGLKFVIPLKDRPGDRGKRLEA